MDELSQTLFGNRNVALAYEQGKEQTTRTAEQRLFSRHFAPSEYADLVAALDGSVITVDYDGQTDRLVVDVQNDFYEFYEICVRELFVDNTGKKTIENVLLQVKRPPAPPGVGARITARQVEMASRLGFDQIVLQAAGSPAERGAGGFVGYHVWPRLGYTMQIADKTAELEEAGFIGVTNTNQLILQPGGYEWWMKNGRKGRCVFDISPDLDSRKVLDFYLAQRKIVAHE